MKLRYAIESVLNGTNKELPEYLPVGVWVLSDNDVRMFYLEIDDPTVALRKKWSAMIVTRLVDEKVVVVPEDFLDVHRDRMSSYKGILGETVSTDKYPSMLDCAKAVLATIQ